MTEESRTMDKRTIERYIRSGVVDAKDYEKFIKSLPDVAAKSMPVEVDDDPTQTDN